MELAAVQTTSVRRFISLGTMVYDLQTQGEQGVLGQGEVQRLMKKIDEEKLKVREIESAIDVISQERKPQTRRILQEKTPPPPA